MDFGGQWTSIKLDCLREYLEAYTTALRNKFTLHYGDAFAGEGFWKPTQKDNQLLQLPGFSDNSEEKPGSPAIALRVKHPFNKYHFNEKNRENLTKLNAYIRPFIENGYNIATHNLDANEWITMWVDQLRNKTDRAVLFLDPFGMQVDWKSMEAIATSGNIDVWSLIPHGIAISRLMPMKSMPVDIWSDRLDRFFGTNEWRKEFYDIKEVRTLGDSHDNYIEKSGNYVSVGEYYIKKLKSIFPYVTDAPLSLPNRAGRDMFLLVFAIGNDHPAAIALAKRLSESVIKKYGSH